MFVRMVTKQKKPAAKKSTGKIKFNFVFLESEREALTNFQAKCKRAGRLFNQSEVLRAGIYALRKLTKDQLEDVANEVPQL